MKSSKYSFIKHDSVLKLNDIRTISSQRLLYTHQGNIPVSSETYQKIQELVITKYFPTFLYETRRKLEDMNNQISEKNREIEKLKKQLEDTL